MGDAKRHRAHEANSEVTRVMSEYSWKSLILQNRQARSYGASSSVMGPPAEVPPAAVYDMWGRMMNGAAQTLPKGEGHTLSCKCKFCKAKDALCNPHLY